MGLTPLFYGNYYLLIYSPSAHFSGLHLPAENVDTEKLKPLPQKEMLRLSMQTDIVQEQNLKWACEAASKLQPEDGR